MASTKLTLSVDEQTVAWARDLSQQKHVSISRMFAGYIQSLRQTDRRAIAAGPLGREAMAIGRRLRRKVPAGFDAKEVLAQALAEKHGVDL